MRQRNGAREDGDGPKRHRGGEPNRGKVPPIGQHRPLGLQYPPVELSGGTLGSYHRVAIPQGGGKPPRSRGGKPPLSRGGKPPLSRGGKFNKPIF
ncbi:hypothetical protein PVBG_03097 [Plasmodium vivax Brazil I]|uniref:Uncharacterized protein n=1 Tax=Plasmodium vivax (strain Brazil I) TaxID=1033975 RepID=A0A0J9VPG8_PLAV1|nr:hypothetical protein PVBG_03097 [Plasmodium vivax Brazil I]